MSWLLILMRKNVAKPWITLYVIFAQRIYMIWHNCGRWGMSFGGGGMCALLCGTWESVTYVCMGSLLYVYLYRYMSAVPFSPSPPWHLTQCTPRSTTNIYIAQRCSTQGQHTSTWVGSRGILLRVASHLMHTLSTLHIVHQRTAMSTPYTHIHTTYT